ncbi:hypothetical protein Ptr86124_001744 [Pyrenophora tritici-repentis]|uniref:Uncharacterized protein n=1 Tax=Pyrenophora tritici-repentis TaxID=45151 RepID=A0A922NMH4_9PLEO|nr:hypothetical protein Ptr86124_001744 [Pyrenophora tritici-repentis]
MRIALTTLADIQRQWQIRLSHHAYPSYDMSGDCLEHLYRLRFESALSWYRDSSNNAGHTVTLKMSYRSTPEVFLVQRLESGSLGDIS